jgi:transcriptional regulator with XRE-family HTH domain
MNLPLLRIIAMTHFDTRIQSPLEFGTQLLVARKACGLTQRQAALRAGVSTRLWNEAEKGKRAQIGLETALRMMRAVGIELGVLNAAQRTLIDDDAQQSPVQR